MPFQNCLFDEITVVHAKPRVHFEIFLAIWLILFRKVETFTDDSLKNRTCKVYNKNTCGWNSEIF